MSNVFWLDTGGTMWWNGRSRPFDDADRSTLRELCDGYDRWNRGKGDGYLKPVGRRLFEWLGEWGPEVIEGGLLEVRAEAKEATFLLTPWEILHDGKGFG